MNIKISTNNYQQQNLKSKNKPSKQLEQEQNHKYGDHLEGYHWVGGVGRTGEKVQGLRCINSRYKTDSYLQRSSHKTVS